MEKAHTSSTNKPSPYLALSFFVLTVLLAAQSSPLSSLSLTTFLTVAASGATAAWLSSSVNLYVGLLSAVPVGAISYFLSGGSWNTVLFSLFYLVYGVTFTLVAKRRLTRASAIGLSSILLSLFTILFLLVPVYNKQGSVSVNAIQNVYADFFKALIDLLKKSFTLTVAGNEISYISDANIHTYLNLMIGMMPGMIALVWTLVGFVCGWCYRLLRRLSRQDPPEDPQWRLSPSPVTALFFGLAFFVSTISETVTHLWLAAITLLLALIPEFCMAGLSSVFEVRYVMGLPRPRIFRGLLLLLGMFNGIGGLVVVSAIFGVTDSLRSAFPKKTNQA